MARKHKKTLIKESLIKQLKEKGTEANHYLDLIDDYMSMWDIKKKLIKDIEKRGVSIKYQNGPNQWGYKKNDSIAELIKTNGQMLKILNELDLKVSEIEKIDEDEDEEM